MQERDGVTPEVRLAVAALRACAILAFPAALIGLLTGGRAAAAGAVTGVGIVAALVLVSMPLYRWGASRPAGTVVRVAALGVTIRLVLAAVLLAVAAQIPGLEATALAAGLVSALLATQMAEMIAATRDPRLFWVDPGAKKRTAA